MRILFLSHYYPPEVNAPANRVHEHARGWVEDGRGHTVITGVPRHPLGEIFPGYPNGWFQREETGRLWVERESRREDLARRMPACREETDGWAGAVSSP
ncbi:MAG: glycosyltransferase family 4 protein [bacterium]|nr:glycosyltransferase family 4 protein [bacterium]